MNAKKNKGLGKGLSALFGDQKKSENTDKIQSTKVALIGELARNKYQPRTIFDDKKYILQNRYLYARLKYK